MFLGGDAAGGQGLGGEPDHYLGPAERGHRDGRVDVGPVDQLRDDADMTRPACCGRSTVTCTSATWSRQEPGPAGPPVLYHHHACGQISHVELRCSECGQPMRATDIDVLPGPGTPTPDSRPPARRGVTGSEVTAGPRCLLMM